MKRWTVPLAAVLLAACGPVLPTHPIGPTPPPLDAGARQIVFQISSGGGLTPANFSLGSRPGLTIFGNGDAYVVHDQVDYRAYPGRPIAFTTGTVSRARLTGLVRLAARSGLFAGADYGNPLISDAGGTSVSFRPDRAAARTVSVYALGVDDADGTLTADQRQNRRSLREFDRRLFDSVRLDPTAMWTPTRIDVVEAYGRDDRSDPSLRWTGPRLDGLLAPSKNHGPRCGVVSGPDARRIYATARANSTTHWRDGTTDRFLVVRALLPGERGC